MSLITLFQYTSLFYFPVTSVIFVQQLNKSLLSSLTLWPFGSKKSKKVVKKIEEDAKLLTNELIQKYKYPSQKYEVTTEDGYILTLHRIPKPGMQPILLMHGILESSASFVFLGPKNSLAFLLSDLQYDIWLGNSRGNCYSRKHRKLKPNQKEFWDFSWHEMGLYDLPAMIDYIRNTTSFHSIYYIGRGQGATAFFVMSSLKPEFNEKIILMQGLGPKVFMNSSKTQISEIEAYLSAKKGVELMPQGWINSSKCYKGAFSKWLCMEKIFSIVGKDSDQLDQDLLPIIFGHIPAGGSVKQAKHFLQNYYSKGFYQYDYGKTENTERYKQPKPPEYNLSNVNVPVILYFADNDFLASLSDVHRLYKILPNIKGLYSIGNGDFNYMDFIWAKNLKNIFFDKFSKIFNKFINGQLSYVVE